LRWKPESPLGPPENPMGAGKRISSFRQEKKPVCRLLDSWAQNCLVGRESNDRFRWRLEPFNHKSKAPPQSSGARATWPDAMIARKDWLYPNPYGKADLCAQDVHAGLAKGALGIARLT
jgi:hypothetical protein